MMLLALIFATACVIAAPVASPVTLAAGPGTLIVNGTPEDGTIVGKAPFGTFTAINGPGGETLHAANPIGQTFDGNIAGGTAHANGVAPGFTMTTAVLDASGGTFVGNGPLGTLILGETQVGGGEVLTFEAQGTRTADPDLTGYVASGALTIEPTAIGGGLVATNAHSTIKATLAGAPNGVGGGGTIGGTLPTPAPLL